MARLAKRSSSPTPETVEDLYGTTPEPANRTARYTAVAGPSPSNGGSDKENARVDKGKGSVPPASRLSATPAGLNSTGKRNRLHDGGAMLPPGPRQKRTIEVHEDDAEGLDVTGAEMDLDEDDCYDPDQDTHERRKVRSKLRELSKTLNDNRVEFLNAESRGLADTLIQANDISNSVKQTADATIDSRLLVTTADMSYRKTVQQTMGDSAQGVDVDEFVSKCITLMKRADGADGHNVSMPSGTQRSRRTTQHADLGSDDESGDDGDMLNWNALGRVAVQYNLRPAMPGFLLGPLSLEKRTRKIQRKPGLRINSLKQTQPELLNPEDIKKSENSNLTALCQNILHKLQKAQDDGARKVEHEAEAIGDMTESEIRELMWKHGVLATGGVDMFRFVINPRSFGQTVENLFYVSFLVRDGKAGVEFDEDGLPSLAITQPRGRNDSGGQGVSKHQAILDLDMKSWRNLIDAFDIREPMISHRDDDSPTVVGGRGWYS